MRNGPPSKRSLKNQIHIQNNLPTIRCTICILITNTDGVKIKFL